MKNKLMLLVSAIGLLSMACTQEEMTNLPVDDDFVTESFVAKGLDPNSYTLTQTDAATVATMYLEQTAQSRTTVTIKNVIPINGNDGQPALYAINLSKGYLIVPATKNLPPILAQVDNGSYSVEDIPFGRDILISQMIAESDYFKNNEPSSDYKSAWRVYDKKNPIKPQLRSREQPGTDVWYVQSDIIYELSMQGYTCYQLRYMEEEQEDIPNDILERFKNRARYEDNEWEDIDEDMMYKTAFIAVKDYHGDNSSVGTWCLTTKWNQGYPYNNSANVESLGCAIIAVGQIMKYHKYPNTFDWDAMKDELKTYEDFTTETPVSKFLKKIYDDFQSKSSLTTIGKAESVLKGYGYNVTQVSHQNGRYSVFPTYCRGASSTFDMVGHAWVCDGFASIYNRTDYLLYVLDNAYYPKYKFYNIESDMKQSSYTLYHMNWGWGGKENGFFYDGSLYANSTNYNYQRKDLVVYKP